ncbi:MAG TPA: hypothetical protein VKQ29_07325 [Aliidongia sp.]|nr:hypothetical protein [Aliidongia sp.]
MSETVRSIGGALRFCKLDPTAVTAFDPGIGAAKRSFMAALYGAPFYAALLALDVWQAAQKPADLWIYALVQAIAYIVHTAGFPLAVLGLVRILGHVERWPLFVTAQNWFGLPQVVALLVAVVLDRSGILGPLGTLLLVIVQFYSLAVEAYVARLTLGVTALASLAVVLLDLVLGVAIDQFAATLF